MNTKHFFSRIASLFLLMLTAFDSMGEVRYVNANNPTPASPYTDWSTAATSIQDAVDAAVAGDQILVTNGVYATGGRVMSGSTSNRVVINKPVMVQSVNGPSATLIQGYRIPLITNGSSAIRCVYLTNGAVLSGFTLTNGATAATGYGYALSGGGAWCASAGEVITNCVITGNVAAQEGGGVCSGTVLNCMLSNNSANNGGAASSGILSNCTVTGNRAGNGGGGIYNGTANNCALILNSASTGGGAYFSTLKNCALTRNSASNGGGSFSGILIHCTLTGNSAGTAGGAGSSTLKNCLVYFNQATSQPETANVAGGNLTNCCTFPATNGPGNIDANPLLADAFHISASSPCRDAGLFQFSSGVDIDGDSWANPPSIGCDEFFTGSLTGAMTVSIQAPFTNLATGFTAEFSGIIDGHAGTSAWDFGDGTIVSNQPYASHMWSVPGDYPVMLWCFNNEYPDGVSATVQVHVVTSPVYHVALKSGSPTPPYAGWGTAATNIQDAIDAAVAGGTVLVSNGVYQTGGRVVNGSMSNRVSVIKPLTVQSLNGPAVTTIRGYKMGASINGNSAIRCVYLTNGATLAGFTLTNGATRTSGDIFLEQSGGGVCCPSANATVSNCVIIGNAAYQYGGGVVRGTLNNVILTNNAAAFGGGAYSSWMNNCALTNNSAGLYGGGVAYGTLAGCTLTCNTSRWSGAGTYFGTASNCVFFRNAAATNGGGSYFSALYDCALIRNTALYGGGAAMGTLIRCTMVSNTASQYGGGSYSSTLINCALTNNSAAKYGGGVYAAIVNGSMLISNTASQVGGGAHSSTLDDCVLTGNSAVQSAGGAHSGTLNNCVLEGNSAPNGGGAYSSALTFCTLTRNSATQSGGGAHSGMLSNCVVAGNLALNGGGAYGAMLRNCALMTNTVSQKGGGAHSGTLIHCTLTGNAALWGGGAHSATLKNSILHRNQAVASPDMDNHASCNLTNCCTTPLPSGAGNIAVDPLLADFRHLSEGSPCRGAGNAQFALGVDIDGDAWTNPPSIGCDEFCSGSLTGAISLAIQAPFTNVATGFPAEFTAILGGHVGASSWNFGDGTVVSNQPCVSHAWTTAGDYLVVLSGSNNDNPTGTNTTLWVHVMDHPTHYVALNSGAPAAPYSTWETAATNIQDAIDATTAAGALVYVSNGVYAVGGRAVYGSMTNRVAVTKPLTLQSVNGPDVTRIEGYAIPGTTNGNGAIRCVYLTNGAALNGFTLTNGATRSAGDAMLEQSGGGVWCSSYRATVSNCVLVANASKSNGGGACSGTLIDSALTGNWTASGGGHAYGVMSRCLLSSNSSSSYGGGAYYCSVSGCTVANNSSPIGGGLYAVMATACTLTGNSAQSGGGSYIGMLNDCLLTNNRAAGGGGSVSGVVSNCVFTGNVATNDGGGVSSCTAFKCLITGNSASWGGGSSGGTLNDCVLTNNTALQDGGGASSSTLNDCLLIANAATNSGGGTYRGVLTNSTLTANTAFLYGGGACEATLNNCTLAGNSTAFCGGGAHAGSLWFCTLTGNTALRNGGGANEAILNNCTLTGNSAMDGGGAYDGTLNDCVLTGNTASNSGGGLCVAIAHNCTLTGNSASTNGGGVTGCGLINCIAQDNSAPDAPNFSSSTLNYCSTQPLPTNGQGNITNAPLFVDFVGGNLRLMSNSPCINSGKNIYVTNTTDFDGNPRIVGGTVDMGSFEFQTPASTISYAWLQQYQLPTDGSADAVDTDLDRLNNWQEWVAGTDPTNAASVLRMLSVTNTGSGVEVSWTGVFNRLYSLQRATNMNQTPVFSTVHTVVAGQDGVQTYQDAGATGPGPFFYRVNVDNPF